MPQSGPARILISLSHALPLSTAPLHHRRACFSLTVAYPPPPTRRREGCGRGRYREEREGRAGAAGNFEPTARVGAPPHGAACRRLRRLLRVAGLLVRPAGPDAGRPGALLETLPRACLAAQPPPSEPASAGLRRPASAPLGASSESRTLNGPPRTAGLDPSVTARGPWRWRPTVASRGLDPGWPLARCRRRIRFGQSMTGSGQLAAGSRSAAAAAAVAVVVVVAKKGGKQEPAGRPRNVAARTAAPRQCEPRCTTAPAHVGPTSDRPGGLHGPGTPVRLARPCHRAATRGRDGCRPSEGRADVGKAPVGADANTARGFLTDTSAEILQVSAERRLYRYLQREDYTGICREKII